MNGGEPRRSRFEASRPQQIENHFWEEQTGSPSQDSIIGVDVGRTPYYVVAIVTKAAFHLSRTARVRGVGVGHHDLEFYNRRGTRGFRAEIGRRGTARSRGGKSQQG